MFNVQTVSVYSVTVHVCVIWLIPTVYNNCNPSPFFLILPEGDIMLLTGGIGMMGFSSLVASLE